MFFLWRFIVFLYVFLAFELSTMDKTTKYDESKYFEYSNGFVKVDNNYYWFLRIGSSFSNFIDLYNEKIDYQKVCEKMSYYFNVLRKQYPMEDFGFPKLSYWLLFTKFFVDDFELLLFIFNNFDCKDYFYKIIKTFIEKTELAFDASKIYDTKFFKTYPILCKQIVELTCNLKHQIDINKH